MNAVVIVAIVFGSIVAVAGLICTTLILLIKMRHNGITTAGKKASREEAQMIQEIYQGLNRMEERIEALETILMEGQANYGENRK
jgi:phage shock protein B